MLLRCCALQQDLRVPTGPRSIAIPRKMRHDGEGTSGGTGKRTRLCILVLGKKTSSSFCICLEDGKTDRALIMSTGSSSRLPLVGVKSGESCGFGDESNGQW